MVKQLFFILGILLVGRNGVSEGALSSAEIKLPNCATAASAQAVEPAKSYPRLFVFPAAIPVNNFSAVAPPPDLQETPFVLEPGRRIVVGRQSSGRPEAMDPDFKVMNLIPSSDGTGLSIFTGIEDDDLKISRAHFQIVPHYLGMLVINGYPKKDGSTGTNKNGLALLFPEVRMLGEGEQYLIRRGESAKLALPNGKTFIFVVN